MNDPTSPLGWHVWRRGAKLGLQWLIVFAAATVGLYVLLGALGWGGIAQALCAMFTGPVIGTALIVVWWLRRRPEWGVSSHQPESGAGDREYMNHE